MTVLRGFAIVIASVVAGALAGLGIGYSLGSWAPAYYRGVIRAGDSPNFDPVQVGIGLGLTQGAGAGLVVGCVIVLAVAWHNSRRQVVIQGWAGSTSLQPPGGRDIGSSEAFTPSPPPSAHESFR
jgi:hypothetical protein